MSINDPLQQTIREMDALLEQMRDALDESDPRSPVRPAMASLLRHKQALEREAMGLDDLDETPEYLPLELPREIQKLTESSPRSRGPAAQVPFSLPQPLRLRR